jgi:hypothetical protein
MLLFQVTTEYELGFIYYIFYMCFVELNKLHK